MRNLPLNALRAFACVLETGGVRSAARELRITHSAVSRHLRELEAWLDVPIVEAAAAAAGHSPLPRKDLELARHASAALRDLERAARAVRERHHSSSVTVATTPSFAALGPPPRLAAFGEDHARIELSLVVDQRVADPASQGADIAIRMGRGPWREVEAEPLMGDALVPVMSPGLWERSGRPSSPEALVRLRLLHDRDPHAHWELWRSEHGPPELDTRAGPRFVSSDLVLRAAEEGLGVALAGSGWRKPIFDPAGWFAPSETPWSTCPTHTGSRDRQAHRLEGQWRRSSNGSGPKREHSPARSGNRRSIW